MAAPAATAEVVVYTDGGARGNPGPAGIGVHMTTTAGRTLDQIAEAIGHATNNVAEYTAVIRALERAQEMGAKRVQVRADSLLVVEQLRGVYKVKNPMMQKLHKQARELVKGFERVSFEHVPRAKNKKADALVNQAIDAWLLDHDDEPEAPPKSEEARLF